MTAYPELVASGPPIDQITWTTAHERVCGGIADAFTSSAVVALMAGPGWGKTTAAHAYATGRPGDVRWLARRSEASDSWAALTREALLAEVASDRGRGNGSGTRRDLLLVLDGVDDAVVSRELRAPLEMVLGRRPHGLRVLITGRRTPELAGLLDDLRIPTLGEPDLRLSMQELSQLARGLGDPYWHDGSELMRLTGGWVRGVLSMLTVESLSEAPPDDLFDYLRNQIFDPLPLPVREALTRFSIIDRLDSEVAAALVGEGAERIWHHLRFLQLPLTAVTDTELILRPPMQAFLQEQVREITSESLDELRMRYLDYLADNGRFGDAISWCMRLEDSRTALSLMEAQVGRAGAQPPAWEVFASWLAGVGEQALLSNDRIAAALLRRLHADDRGEEASSLARMLVDEGRTEAIIESADPDVRPILMLSLLRPTDDLMQFSKASRGVVGLQAASYMLAVMGGEVEVAEPPPAAWGDMAVVVRWGNFWQGQLTRLVETAGAGENPESPHADIPTIVASLWTGDVELARQLWNSLDERSKSRPLESFAGAALCIAEGDFAAAHAVMEDCIEVARISTASFEHAVFRALIQFLEGRTSAAIDELPQRIREMRTYRRLAIAEWASLVLSMALTGEGRAAEAEAVLDLALASMSKAGRYLFLGAGMTLRAYLHQAAGDHGRAREVLARLAAIPYDRRNPYWEGLVRDRFPLEDVGDAVNDSLPTVVKTESTGGPSRGEAVFDPFGWPAVLEIDGRKVELRRTKYAELIALLVHSGGRADRRRILTKLFPEADRKRASNHLRQIIFKLRESTGIVLERVDPDFIAWPEAMTLKGLDVEFEQQVGSYLSADAPDAVRHQEILATLRLGKSAYLEGSDLEWVVERREQLSVLFEEVAIQVINQALRRGDIDTVRAFGQHALRLNPYGEDLYQAMMEAELRFGSRPRGLALYRDAYTRLRELDLEPSPALRALAGRLRDA